MHIMNFYRRFNNHFPRSPPFPGATMVSFGSRFRMILNPNAFSCIYLFLLFLEPLSSFFACLFERNSVTVIPCVCQISAGLIMYYNTWNCFFWTVRWTRGFFKGPFLLDDSVNDQH